MQPIHLVKHFNLLDGFKRAFTIDYRTLALFRVIIASIVLIDLYFRSQYFTALFTDQGILPRSVVINWFRDASYSLYFINGSAFFNAILVFISIIAALCMLIGHRTRLATIVTWVLLVSLHHRTSILSSGADDLMRLLLFWGMFLPIGARFSVDAALEKSKVFNNSGILSIATVGLLMQVMYVYWVGALLKTHPQWQVDFSSIYYALSAEHYSTWLGAWVLTTFEPILPALTRFVFLIELYGPLFLVTPIFLLWLRLPVLFLLICMHIGFALLLNVGHFPFVSICSLLLFLPKECWDKVSQFKWFKRSEGVHVFYDKDCTFCLKTVKILQQIFILPAISISPAQDDKIAAPLLKKHDSWVVQKPTGETLIEWSALAYLSSLSPILFWLKWPLQLMVKLNIGDKVYHFIGDRRRCLGSVTAYFLPWRESKSKPSIANHAIAMFFLVYCFQLNMLTVYPNEIPEIPYNNDIKRSLGLWQKWNMFAPKPIQRTSWPIFEGITRDNRKVDIFRHQMGAAPTAKPDHILSDYKYYRWRKYFGRIYLKKYSYLRRHFVAYECKQWNKNRSYKDQITKISLKMGKERTLLPSHKEKEIIESMGTWNCR